MSTYNKDLSNMSYTNKDFNDIYPELLELAQKLSYKWDPTISDESDPGVVLLKLAAIIGDKNNYNIDKNILELFPNSVTQYSNARQLFEQLGYKMRYYESATTEISVVMTEEPEISQTDVSALLPAAEGEERSLDPSIPRIYKIPAFTMFSDTDNNIVYTTTESISVRSDGITPTPAPAIQGTVNKKKINGEEIITSQHLDDHNRIYFSETNIPENGIFIRCYNTSEPWWQLTDNLLLEPLGSKVFSFGVTDDGYSCYVEFPDDIDELIGEGITITYVRSSGADGNIGKKRINQFFTDVKVERSLDTTTEITAVQPDVTLSTKHVFITNNSAATNGKDPESIESAYRNYQRTKGTFDTLVSLRDYYNFLYTNRNISNGFVCDRTNDPQSTYKVITVDNQGDVSTTNIVKENLQRIHNAQDASGKSVTAYVSEPELDAFDLRVYGLEYIPDPSSLSGYIHSFDLIPYSSNNQSSWGKIESDTELVKSIQHNYRQYEPDRILMIKNKYPIIAKIVPTYKLSTAEQTQVEANVCKALYSELNSRVVDFGTSPNYGDIFDTITNADDRIKGLSLNDITYETYAVYFDSVTQSYQELRIDNESARWVDDHYVEEPVNKLSERQTTLWKNFRSDIRAKSILAGVTPFVNADKGFTFAITQADADIVNDVETLTTNTIIPVRPKETVGHSYESPLLAENENIVFTSPNMIVEQEYSSGVLFIHNIGLNGRTRNPYDTSRAPQQLKYLEKDSEYTLGKDEFIIFFWKAEDDDYAPYIYKKYSGNSATSDAVTISPNFQLTYQNDVDKRGITDYPSVDYNNILKSLPDGKGTTESMSSFGGYTATEFISNLAGRGGSTFTLTGTNTIQTKKINKLFINNPDNGTKNVFFILNNATTEARLFGEDGCHDKDSDNVSPEDKYNTYTLKDNEYFIYSNATGTQLVMLGSGTKLSRKLKTTNSTLDGQLKAFVCEAVDYDMLIAQGPKYLDGRWFKIPTDGTKTDIWEVYATEMKFTQLGPDNKVNLTWQGNSNDSADYFIEDNYTIGAELVQNKGKNADDTTFSQDKLEQIEESIYPNGWYTASSTLHAPSYDIKFSPESYKEGGFGTLDIYRHSPRIATEDELEKSFEGVPYFINPETRRITLQSSVDLDITSSEYGVNTKIINAHVVTKEEEANSTTTFVIDSKVGGADLGRELLTVPEIYVNNRIQKQNKTYNETDGSGETWRVNPSTGLVKFNSGDGGDFRKYKRVSLRDVYSVWKIPTYELSFDFSRIPEGVTVKGPLENVIDGGIFLGSNDTMSDYTFVDDSTKTTYDPHSFAEHQIAITHIRYLKDAFMSYSEDEEFKKAFEVYAERQIIDEETIKTNVSIIANSIVSRVLSNQSVKKDDKLADLLYSSLITCRNNNEFSAVSAINEYLNYLSNPTDENQSGPENFAKLLWEQFFKDHFESTGYSVSYPTDETNQELFYEVIKDNSVTFNRSFVSGSKLSFVYSYKDKELTEQQDSGINLSLPRSSQLRDVDAEETTYIQTEVITTFVPVFDEVIPEAVDISFVCNVKEAFTSAKVVLEYKQKDNLPTVLNTTYVIPGDVGIHSQTFSKIPTSNIEYYKLIVTYYSTNTQPDIVMTDFATIKLYILNSNLYQLPDSSVSSGFSEFNISLGVVLSNRAQTLEKYRISYSDADSTTTLPARSTKETAWNGYTLLNINASTVKPQMLLARQSVTIDNRSEVEIQLDEAWEKVIEIIGKMILANRAVSLTGGENVDATTLDSQTGNILPLSIYAYNQWANKQSESKISTWTADNFTTEFNMFAKQGNDSIDFSIVPGHYLLKTTLDHQINSLQYELNVSGKKVEVIPLRDTDSNSSNFGNHYFYFNIPTSLLDDSTVLPAEFKITFDAQNRVSKLNTAIGYTGEIIQSDWLPQPGNTYVVCDTVKRDYTYKQPMDLGNTWSAGVVVTDTTAHNDNSTATGQPLVWFEISGLRVTLHNSDIGEEGLKSNAFITVKSVQDDSVIKSFTTSNHGTHINGKSLTGRIELTRQENLFTLYYQGKKLGELESNNVYSQNTELKIGSEALIDTLANAIRIDNVFVTSEYLNEDLPVATLTINPLLKFSPTTEDYMIEDSTTKISPFSSFAHQIDRLDVNKIFDYTYDVPENVLIMDPLEAVTFNDENHIFNPYTICMWDVTKTFTNVPKEFRQIMVVNKVK